MQSTGSSMEIDSPDYTVIIKPSTCTRAVNRHEASVITMGHGLHLMMGPMLQVSDISTSVVQHSHAAEEIDALRLRIKNLVKFRLFIAIMTFPVSMQQSSDKARLKVTEHSSPIGKVDGIFLPCASRGHQHSCCGSLQAHAYQ
eukprot:2161891-Amphidinium_carterae.1